MLDSFNDGEFDLPKSKHSNNSIRNSIIMNNSFLNSPKNTLNEDIIDFKPEMNGSKEISHNRQSGSFNLNDTDRIETKIQRHSKKRTKSGFFKSNDFKLGEFLGGKAEKSGKFEKDLVSILIPVNIDQIEMPPTKSDDGNEENFFKFESPDFPQTSKANSNISHLLISPTSKSKKMRTQHLSENTIINGIDFDIDVQELNFQNDCSNKISIVSLNKGNSDKKEKRNSMTIHELLRLIRKKSMEGLLVTNEIGQDTKY